MLCKAIFLLQVEKEGTFDSHVLPPGRFLISASAVPHCRIKEAVKLLNEVQNIHPTIYIDSTGSSFTQCT